MGDRRGFGRRGFCWGDAGFETAGLTGSRQRSEGKGPGEEDKLSGRIWSFDETTIRRAWRRISAATKSI
jgi:hypothetical protein